MKDSHVAWMGEVPAHWEVVRIKRVISSIEQGWSPQCENFPITSPDEWGVLKVGCVNGGVFRPIENKKLPPELEPVPAYSLKRGDLLISRANTRELVGSAAAVETDFDNLMLCDKLYRLRLDKARCTPSYLAAYLGTPHARSQIELEATGASSSMLNIGQYAILDLPAPMPSVTEQNEIQEFLRAETGRLDALNAVAERAIILLKERRSALIAAAVTGQIDVRGAMPQAAIENLEAIAA
jgi:type I restriction enzyme S subunit